jgi:hypothetical protein
MKTPKHDIGRLGTRRISAHSCLIVWAFPGSRDVKEELNALSVDLGHTHPHNSEGFTEYLRPMKLKLLLHPTCTPDQAQTDFGFFDYLKKTY